MLTRCPACTTTFRVTPEQLKARGGKVRCGKCQSVFNALDSLDEAPASASAAAAPEKEARTATVIVAPPVVTASTQQDDSIDILLEPPTTAGAAPATDDDGVSPPDAEELLPSSPEAIRDAGLNAGLVAARETTEVPGYDKWAEGAFTAPISVSIPTTKPQWPFVLAALLLALTLTAQLAYQFRAELAVSSPSLRPMLEAACALLECDIPLPRQSELVSIEASDLQTDPAHGNALALSATLKNRAPYAQAWPLLEVTLTDVQDNALLRRVLQPTEYLPAKVDPTVFPPSGEVAVRLWLEAKDITAAGYRIYVFYP